MQYLIDASVYVFRAYYSMPEDMVDEAGNPINAFYGFARFIGDFMEQVTPEFIAVAFDESLSSSFRTEIYPDYKANRDPAPPDLKRQCQHCSRFNKALGLQQCRRYVRALGLLELGSPRYEADDLIGTLVEHGRRQGRPSTIVSRDKDLTQLLREEDVFWDFAGKGRLRYEEIPGSFGVWPEQIADFLALAGDAVDNIKGVPGVGKKTAEKLLQHFGSLETIYDNLHRIHEVNVRGSRTLGTKLEMHRDAAMLARRLTGIACDAPIDGAEAALQPAPPKLGEINAERVSDIYRH